MGVEKRRSRASRHSNLTLKEKLQQHWETRKFEPSDESITRFGIGFVWVNTISLVLEGFALLLPHFFIKEGEEVSSFYSSTGLLLSKVATVYLFVGTACQWCYLRDGTADKVCKATKDGYCKDGELPQGWRHCATCKLCCPPRSHHCSLCNACVLKRDHHCFFSGSCVGYHNQRHFIIFLLYSFAASVYGVFMQGMYLKREEGVAYFLPLLAMWRTVTRQSWTLHLVLLLHLYLSAVVAAACVSFVSWQVRIILRGQTSYEAVIGSTKYMYSAGGAGQTSSGKRTKIAKRCAYENFRSACGTPMEFLLCVLAPMVKTKLPGDGVNWGT